MLNAYWLCAPFAAQMLCMVADEFWFHRRRGLPQWERIGHPLDTLTVALCLAWVLCVDPDQWGFCGFVILSLFSCIFVTKDEQVHQRFCSAAEQRLHAFLFMLHPLVLGSTALLWPAVRDRQPVLYPSFVEFSGYEGVFLLSALALMVGFGIYQFVFWNLRWPKAR